MKKCQHQNTMEPYQKKNLNGSGDLRQQGSQWDRPETEYAEALSGRGSFPEAGAAEEGGEESGGRQQPQ